VPVLPEELPLRGLRVPVLSTRSWLSFRWKEADCRICSPRAEEAAAEIRRQRTLLEGYIDRHPLFLAALVPVPCLPGAPAVAVRMADAAARASVGPMAAVAGAMAQAAVEAALAAGAQEAVVENGGDIFLHSPGPVLVGLYAGENHPLSGRLAFRVEPAAMPLSVCASSGRFGHSFSFGDCDLAALERMAGVPGIRGALIVQGDKVGLMGDLPPLVRSRDPRFADKTFHTQPG
jgi:ApbE superfamily uncharacterized protein (UPF0280 family)